MRRVLLLPLAIVCLTGCGASGIAATQPTPTPGPGYRQSVLADHPVGFWPMDEPSGAVMRDASGNGNDGTYQGGVALAQAGPIKATNMAVALDGTSAWASVPNASGFQVNTITIELWINKRSEVEFGPYVTKNFVGAGGAGTGWFQLLNDHHDGRLQLRIDADEPVLASESILALNTWYYVVATYDGTTARLYLNGKLDSSATVTRVPKQAADPIEIGRRNDGLLNNAVLSSVAIYPTALTPSRIAEHWQAASL